MANIEYTVMITPEHTLVVNSNAVPYPQHITEGDSENLLIWALDLVAEQHDRQAGSTLALWIEDQREGGYGNKSVKRLSPGQNVDINALRQRAGFTYAPPQQDEEVAENPVWDDDAEGSPAPEVTTDSPSEQADEEPQPAPEVPQPPAIPQTQEQAEPASPLEAQAEEEGPAWAADQPAEDSDADEGRTTAIPNPAKSQNAPDVASVEDDGDSDSDSETRKSRRGSKKGLFGKSPSGKSKKPKRTKPSEESSSDEESAPKKNPVLAFFSPKPKDETEDKPKKRPAPKGWVPFNRNRPEQEIDEETGEPKKGLLTRRRIAIGLVAVLLLGILAIRVAGGGDEAYVAVCVDDRTMARQAESAPCEEDSSPYFRWWYVPEGEYVPPVGGIAITGNGSTNTPSSEDATITYGFNDDGGVFGGD